MIICGRTMGIGTHGPTPLKHVTIKLTGIWKNLERIAEKPAARPNIVFIHPPMQSDRSAETLCVAGNIYPASDSSDTRLLQNNLEGTKRVLLASAEKLEAGSLIRIDGADAWREEIAIVTKVEANSATVSPAWITLAGPLQFSHRAGTTARKMDVRWESEETSLALDAHRGHSTVFLEDLKHIKANKYLRIGSAEKTSSNEVHRLGTYETESNDDGFYQLPPLQRVGQVQLEANEKDRKVVVKYQPDFSLPRNQVDFVFKKSQTPDSAEENYA